jgi:hypothetical protein
MMHPVTESSKVPSSPSPAGGKPPPVQGKTFILGLLGALLLVVGLVFWAGVSGGSKHVPHSKPGVGFTADEAGAPAAASGSAKAPAPSGSAAPSPPGDAGAIQNTHR